MADEPTPDAPKPEPQDPPEPLDPPAPAKPPWGNDDDFDPKRAWDLIQNTRGDVERVKAELTAAKAKVTEFEAAGKTAEEKLTDRASTAERDNGDLRGQVLRLELALDKGLTRSQAKRLVGTTKEELEKDADELLADFKSTDDTRRPPVGGNRREQLRGGGDPTEEPDERDPRKLAAQIPRS